MRKERATLKVVLLSFACTLSPSIGAQSLSPLLGEWAAPCEFFGTSARCHLQWEAGRHTSLVELRYAVTSLGNEPITLFSGRSTLKQSGETLHGYWTDSNGSMHPVFARFTEMGMESFWGEASTERGRSRYELTDSGALEVTDWVLSEAGWQPFMRVSYQRQ